MTTAALVDQVRSGSNRELQMMAAGGVLPVPPNELIPLQVTLAGSQDREVANIAANSLRALEPRLLASFLSLEADLRTLNYFALEVSDPKVVEAILQRRDVPRSLLVALAPNLGEELQEVLLLRQDAILEEPRILKALESNPQISKYSRRRIREYREHLLPAVAPDESAVELDRPVVEEATDEEVAAAIAAVKAEAPAEAAEVEEHTGLSEAQIRSLPIPVRMRLTRGASRSMRAVLLRDSSSSVAIGCLLNNHFSDQEIEQACLNRTTHEDVLAAISRNRHWVGRYSVIAALVRNPRVPVGNAVRLVPRLSVRDLRDLSRDRNVADPVRQTANRLYRIKTK